jgi:hypothetical protein
VLPVAVDGQGQVHLLLGRESSWRSKNSHAGTWCDFGGVIRNNRCSFSGAAREFVEETLGTVLGHMSTHLTTRHIFIFSFVSRESNGK